MSFSGDINKFTNNVFIKNVTKVFRRSCFEIVKRVIKRSPVGNIRLWKSGRGPKGYTGGRFRANWQAEINSKPRGVIEKIDKSGSATLSKALSKTNKLMIGRKFYLINNLPYSKKIEDGHSKQAPQGMIKVTVAEWQNIVKLVSSTI